MGNYILNNLQAGQRSGAVAREGNGEMDSAWFCVPVGLIGEVSGTAAMLARCWRGGLRRGRGRRGEGAQAHGQVPGPGGCIPLHGVMGRRAAGAKTAGGWRGGDSRWTLF